MTRPPRMSRTQLGAVRALLQAKAYEATVRGWMDPIHAEAVERWKPQLKEKYAGRTHPITWDTLYLTDDATFQDILADVRQMTKERHPSIVPTNPEHCPLLEAESLTNAAERAVVLAFQDWEASPFHGTGTDWHRLLCSGMQVLRQFIDLHVRLALSLHPKELATPSAVLGRSAP